MLKYLSPFVLCVAISALVTGVARGDIGRPAGDELDVRVGRRCRVGIRDRLQGRALQYGHSRTPHSARQVRAQQRAVEHERVVVEQRGGNFRSAEEEERCYYCDAQD